MVSTDITDILQRKNWTYNLCWNGYIQKISDPQFDLVLERILGTIVMTGNVIDK